MKITPLQLRSGGTFVSHDGKRYPFLDDLQTIDAPDELAELFITVGTYLPFDAPKSVKNLPPEVIDDAAPSLADQAVADEKADEKADDGERTELEAQHLAKFGRKAHPQISIEKLKEKLAAE